MPFAFEQSHASPLSNKLNSSIGDETSAISSSPVCYTPNNDKVKPSRRITPIRVTTSEQSIPEIREQLSKTPRRVGFITLSSTTSNDVSMDSSSWLVFDKLINYKNI